MTTISESTILICTVLFMLSQLILDCINLSWNIWQNINVYHFSKPFMVPIIFHVICQIIININQFQMSIYPILQIDTNQEFSMNKNIKLHLREMAFCAYYLVLTLAHLQLTSWQECFPTNFMHFPYNNLQCCCHLPKGILACLYFSTLSLSFRSHFSTPRHYGRTAHII